MDFYKILVSLTSFAASVRRAEKSGRRGGPRQRKLKIESDSESDSENDSENDTGSDTDTDTDTDTNNGPNTSSDSFDFEEQVKLEDSVELDLDNIQTALVSDCCPLRTPHSYNTCVCHCFEGEN